MPHETGQERPGGDGRTVPVVLPGDVDDPAAPSGGNNYDRRICQGLAAAGWRVREFPVAGAWPRPDAAARAELARILAGLPDGAPVLLDGLVACGVPEVLAPHAARLRQVVLVHLPLADETGLAPEIAADLDARERRVLRSATAVVATSAWAGRRLAERHGLPAERVHVAAPGVDLAPPAVGTDDGSRLLCVASVTPRKGHDLLVEALARVADLPWHCTCLGGLDRAPDFVDRVRRSIGAYRLADRLLLAGPRGGADLATTYAAADLLVLPSRTETYGMVVTEALARGIPVLATDVAGVPEALGRTPDGGLPGMLVPPEDPDALAAALRRWLSQPPLRHRLRAAARARRDTLHGWEVTSRSLADLLVRLPRAAAATG